MRKRIREPALKGDIPRTGRVEFRLTPENKIKMKKLVKDMGFASIADLVTAIVEEKLAIVKRDM